MNMNKRLIIYIYLQLFLFILLFFSATVYQIIDNIKIIFQITEVSLLLYLYFYVMLPLRNLDSVLTRFIKKKDTGEEFLKQDPGKTAYINKIKKVIEIYSGQASKDNYARIHDKQAELAALQSQINPHFLYNTLDSIRGQALVENNMEIAKMVEALAGFFRYSISRKGELVTLRDELVNVKNYMMIQQYRFSNRFSLEILIDKEDEISYDYLVPRLIIQPIIENAIYHGLKEKLENGVITIEIILTNNNMILMISDNGEGMDGETLSEVNKRIKSSGQFFDNKNDDIPRRIGIALPNINKRIQLLFGDEYGLNMYSTRNIGTDVEIMLPANYERTTDI